jgi:ATP-dependent Clp protease protease subunit
MIHDPSYLSNDIGGKKPHEIQSQVDKLIETRNVLARIISDVTGKSIEEILKATSEDSYYNAKEALEFGLATGIIKNEKEDES